MLERVLFVTSSEHKHSWGKDVMAEYWDLDL